MTEHFSSRQGTSSLDMLGKNKKTPAMPDQIGDIGGRNQSKRRNLYA